MVRALRDARYPSLAGSVISLTSSSSDLTGLASTVMQLGGSCEPRLDDDRYAALDQNLNQREGIAVAEIDGSTNAIALSRA